MLNLQKNNVRNYSILTPDMKNELHNELTKYLATILEELLTEKNQETIGLMNL